MNQVLHFIFGVLVALSISGKCAGEISDSKSLRVVIIPTRTRVRVGEHFTVRLRIENPTTTNQYVRVMSCSWPQQWHSSSSSIIGPDIVCTFNVPVSKKISAGAAIKCEMEMCVPGPILSGRITDNLCFQLGFTPLDSEKTFWSNEVTIKVSPHA